MLSTFEPRSEQMKPPFFPPPSLTSKIDDELSLLPFPLLKGQEAPPAGSGQRKWKNPEGRRRRCEMLTAGGISRVPARRSSRSPVQSWVSSWAGSVWWHYEVYCCSPKQLLSTYIISIAMEKAVHRTSNRISAAVLEGGCIYYYHFIDGKIISQRLSNMHRAT